MRSSGHWVVWVFRVRGVRLGFVCLAGGLEYGG